MNKNEVPPEYEHLVSIDDASPDVPDHLLNFEPGTGPPNADGGKLRREIERIALVEELTGLPQPSPISVDCEPLTRFGRTLSQIQQTVDSTPTIQELEAAVVNIATARLQAQQNVPEKGDKSWRTLARNIDPDLLNDAIALAEELNEPNSVRVLRILANA